MERFPFLRPLFFPFFFFNFDFINSVSAVLFTRSVEMVIPLQNNIALYVTNMNEQPWILLQNKNQQTQVSAIYKPFILQTIHCDGTLKKKKLNKILSHGHYYHWLSSQVALGDFRNSRGRLFFHFQWCFSFSFSFSFCFSSAFSLMEHTGIMWIFLISYQDTAVWETALQSIVHNKTLLKEILSAPGELYNSFRTLSWQMQTCKHGTESAEWMWYIQAKLYVEIHLMTKLVRLLLRLQ